MNFEKIQELAAFAVDGRVIPSVVKDYCGDYYSPYYGLFFLLGKEFTDAAFADDNSVPPIAVELGVEGGRGSNALLQGGMQVIGIDHNHNPGIDRLIGHKNFTFLHQDSMPAPVEFPPKWGAISLLHIDTEHSYSMAKSEFEVYKPYLMEGAVVCFDDTNAMDGDVLKYVNELPYEKMVDDRLHPSCGFAVIQYWSNK